MPITHAWNDACTSGDRPEGLPVMTHVKSGLGHIIPAGWFGYRSSSRLKQWTWREHHDNSGSRSDA